MQRNFLFGAGITIGAFFLIRRWLAPPVLPITPEAPAVPDSKLQDYIDSIEAGTTDGIT